MAEPRGALIAHPVKRHFFVSAGKRRRFVNERTITTRILLHDNFDEGDYDGRRVDTGWPSCVQYLVEPEVVVSPEGYAVRGIGSGYGISPCPSIMCDLPANSGTELKIEVRAKSGSNAPNSADLILWSGDSGYRFIGYRQVSIAKK